jgi:Ca-activated chloride channel family protein
MCDCGEDTRTARQSASADRPPQFNGASGRASLPASRVSRARIATLVMIWLIAGLSPVFADDFAKRNNTGNSLLNEGKVEEAISEYQAARVERPDQPGVLYNLGSAYHQKGALDTAAAILQNTLSMAQGPLRAHSEYNLGNTFYRQQDFKQAIEAYKQALITDPTDLDAKHNLEMALRQMNSQDSTKDKQQQEKQNQPDSSGQKQDQQKQQQPDSSDQEKQQQQQNQQQQQDQQDQQQNAQQDQQQQDPNQQPAQPRPVQGMTRADAERLLDALKNNELQLQKKRAQRVSGQKVAKDW